LFRDLLSAVTGRELDQMKPQKSNDETLGFPEHQFSAASAKLLLKRDVSKTFLPKISSLRFSAEVTQHIIERSRQENTTIHAAICAAVLIVSRRLRPDWAAKKIEMISPICSRKALGLDDNCGLNITTHPVYFEGEQQLSFWDIAGLAKAGLAGTDTVEHVENYICFFRNLTFTQDIQQILEVLKEAFNQEIMVSNLGQVKYHTDFGDLKLKALYGPMVRSGKGKEQTIGVITSNGSLCLTNTSDTPIEGLLAAMETLLKATCVPAPETV